MSDAKKPTIVNQSAAKSSIFTQAKKGPPKITGMSPTHQLDNDKAGKLLTRAKAKVRLNPDGSEESAELERAFMVARTFTVYREALKWVKLAGVDSRAKRVKPGERRWLEDADSLTLELRKLKKKADHDLEIQPEGLPESLLELLDKCEPLPDQLKP